MDLIVGLGAGAMVRCPASAGLPGATLVCLNNLKQLAILSSTCAGNGAAGGEASTSGRGASASQDRSSRYTATVLDVGPEAAAKAVRECCVFIVPQARNLETKTPKPGKNPEKPETP